MIQNAKIYEPFFIQIWECLKSQPLTTIKLKASKIDNSKIYKNILEVLAHSIKENNRNRENCKLNALQLRLIRIAYKRKLYPLVVNVQECIYEYHAKLDDLKMAKESWQQTVGYIKKINGDTALVSKVRQNKAFEMRRQMNISHYGQKRNHSDSKNKYVERKQEALLGYQLSKEITEKLLSKCCFLILKLNMKIQREIKSLLNEVTGRFELKKQVFEQFKILGYRRSEENQIAHQAIKSMKRWRLYM